MTDAIAEQFVAAPLAEELIHAYELAHEAGYLDGLPTPGFYGAIYSDGYVDPSSLLSPLYIGYGVFHVGAPRSMAISKPGSRGGSPVPV